MIKKGDLLGIQIVLNRLKKLKLDEIMDHYGEVEFSLDEQD